MRSHSPINTNNLHTGIILMNTLIGLVILEVYLIAFAILYHGGII